MGRRIAGTCYIKVDGEQLDLSGNLEFPTNQVTRETIKSTSRVVGYSEELTIPYISGDFIVPADFPWEKITESTSMTITAECANGQVYTLSDAWLAGDAAVKPMDGQVSLRFEGTQGDLA